MGKPTSVRLTELGSYMRHNYIITHGEKSIAIGTVPPSTFDAGGVSISIYDKNVIEAREFLSPSEVCRALFVFRGMSDSEVIRYEGVSRSAATTVRHVMSDEMIDGQMVCYEIEISNVKDGGKHETSETSKKFKLTVPEAMSIMLGVEQEMGYMMFGEDK